MPSRVLVRIGLVLFTSAASVVLMGCPSKEGEQKDAQAPLPNASGNGTGPLAGLESSPFMNEVWIGENGQQTQVLYYARENVRVGASCRQASGQLACDALRFLRNGMPVEIARRSLDGRQSAGVKACQRLNQPVDMVHNSVGSEDSFCRFPDGSVVSTGTLEQYGMRVIQ